MCLYIIYMYICIYIICIYIYTHIHIQYIYIYIFILIYNLKMPHAVRDVCLGGMMFGFESGSCGEYGHVTL